MGLESVEETVVPTPRAGEKSAHAWKSPSIWGQRSQAWKPGIHPPPFCTAGGISSVVPDAAVSAVIAAAALEDRGT